jgi:hypothetical protein
LSIYEALRNVPEARVRNFHNDLYIVSESIRLMQASGAFSASEPASVCLVGFLFWIFLRVVL